MAQQRAHRLIFAVVFLSHLSICSATESPDPTDPNRYLNAVRAFADNVLKYGRDTYGPKHTPLFVDGLNIHTHEPVKWIDPDGTRWILSNLASQQTLFRTLDGLTTMTGDPKYRQAAMDAIRYAFNNLRSPNGLLYWGNTAAYDATADQPCRGRISHGLRLIYPFYELMWQVDPEVTRQFIESFWSAAVLDWSKLDFNRYGFFDDLLEEAWNHKYDENAKQIFEGKGKGFPSAATSLIQAGTILSVLSGQEQPLVWSKRLRKRYVDTGDPNTGFNKVYNVPASKESHGYTGSVNRVLVYTESIKAHLWISWLLAGEILGAEGMELRRWTLEEMAIWSRATYREKSNSSVPAQPEGAHLEGYTPKETDNYSQLFTHLSFFWAYTTAHHVTGDVLMWEIVRDIALCHSFRDIGKGPTGTPGLDTTTTCSNVYALLGFLELYAKTNKKEFLDIAQRIGDNIVSNQLHKGFFVPSQKHIYTRFDCFEPLALLRLWAATKSKMSSMPRVWPSCTYFVHPYRHKQGVTDRRVIYTLTESNEPPLSLHEAAAIGDVELVRSLLEKGVGVNSWDDGYLKTPLQYAAINGHRRVVELLLDKGARIDAQDDWPGATALGYAAEHGHNEVVELLITKDAGVTTTREGPPGDTPLHSAARAGRKRIVELLIANGADINVKNKQGLTPLLYSQERGHTEIVELLKEHGAKE